MINITLHKLAKIVTGEVVGNNATFNTVSIDSRHITQECLFIALKGNKFDAHNFAVEAKEQGAKALLVHQKLDLDLAQVIVKDTRLALSKLAAWVRQNVPTRVVAITGSSGKTSVKEMTMAILKQCGNTLCTQDNLNNDIGVSITLLRLTKSHDNAVIELGTNHQGEIAWTTSLACPEVALVNNFSISHLDGFGSLENISKEKGEIYNGLSKNGIAIINDDSHDWKNWKYNINSRKTWRFSLKSLTSHFSATNICINPYSTKFTLHTPIGNIDICLPLPGIHNISNALAASALSVAIEVPLSAIKTGLENFTAIPGRLFPILISKNKLLLDDSYNANVSSMLTAIEVLTKMPGYRVMVVGDMAELGNNSEVYHAKIGKAIKMTTLNRVLSVGNLSRIIATESRIGESFSNKKELVKRLKELIAENKVITILVKGSHCSSMIDVINALQETRSC